MPADPTVLPDVDAADAAFAVGADVDAADAAFAVGDWGKAHAILDGADLTRLTDEDRARVESLRAKMGTDRVATAIAVGLGLTFVVIIVLLYF